MLRRLIIGTLALAVTACSGERPATGAAERELQVVAPFEMHSLDPSRTGFLFTRMQVAETLLGVDDAGRPTPGLASGWQRSADGLSWRFTLRPGARFHDGQPVTAAIVAADLRRAQGQPGNLRQAPIAAIDADRDGAVVVRLSAPSALLPAILAQYDTQILAPSSFDRTGAVTRVIGSGPYRITAINKQGFAVALAASWSGPRPAVRRARYLAVTRDEARAVMAESGQADLVVRLAPTSLARLRQRPALTVLTGMLPRTTILLLDAGGPFFADVQARQALSLAIDRRGVAEVVLRDPRYAATQLFPPIMTGWYDPALVPLGYDPQRSARLFAALGWRRGGDGVLQRGGQRLALTLLTYGDRAELPVIATAVQEQLRRAGIAATIDIGDNAEIPARHKAGTLQLGIAARTYVVVPDPTGTLLQDFAPGGGDWGAMHWSDPTLVAALRRLTAGADPAAKVQLRRQVAATLHAHLPVIPLMWYEQTATAGARIRGATLDPYERSYRLTDLRWAQP